MANSSKSTETDNINPATCRSCHNHCFFAASKSRQHQSSDSINENCNDSTVQRGGFTSLLRTLKVEMAFFRSKSTCVCVCAVVCVTVCLSSCMPVCLSACLPVCLSACLPVYLPACLPVCLSA